VEIAKFIIVLALAYFLGSIPFGLLIGKLTGKRDVRQFGSGKTGATNVLRTAGRKAAATVAVLDVLKGVLAVVLAGVIMGSDSLLIGDFAFGALLARTLAALAAVAGHNWPFYLKFRGGRGVATFMGGLVALYPPAAIFGGEVLIIGAGLSRYVSLGSMVGVASACLILIPLVILGDVPVEYLTYASIGAIVIIVMHRDNIHRLLTGKERRLGENSDKSAGLPGKGAL
jgi:glycerol-3-phosphate acyltransferase PlsY